MIPPQVWVIGFPRCGTVSLCDALTILGWTPLHNPRHWDMLEGYNAAADVFITAHWRELFEMFPDDKFILNTRDLESWLQSLQRIPGFWKSRLLYDRYHRLKVYGTEDVSDHQTLTSIWEEHHREVSATIPSDQLLKLSLPFSWKPLCEFLQVPTPDQPFPWKNKKTHSDAVIRRVTQQM
ncbi:sulfotransferase family protein [Thalassoglobus sp.]|uniref:sulfotransferase family protein n=1 Tax=Thalassoglobus sp. TaxID=2795869 RepID=UPI003AA98733